jgi:cell division protein FtsW (lipid II flippase)
MRHHAVVNDSPARRYTTQRTLLVAVAVIAIALTLVAVASESRPGTAPDGETSATFSLPWTVFWVAELPLAVVAIAGLMLRRWRIATVAVAVMLLAAFIAAG